MTFIETCWMAVVTGQVIAIIYMVWSIFREL